MAQIDRPSSTAARMNKVTLKDIAKVANVSYTTVSRALSGDPEISEHTRERIMQISSDMGYTTNYIARSMVKKKTELFITSHVFQSAD